MHMRLLYGHRGWYGGSASSSKCLRSSIALIRQLVITQNGAVIHRSRTRIFSLTKAIAARKGQLKNKCANLNIRKRLRL